MSDLAYVLRLLPRRDDPNLLAGTGLGDDAAVYRLTDDLALVQSVDFFTPIVDDPYAFGQIAAANSLGDIYAMGGTPLTALNIIGFPVQTLPREVLVEILRGGADKAAEAGVTVAGGHTIDDQEPKYGLAVTGTVHPRRYLSGNGALPGDLLVLTKPIGSGVIATALKADSAAPDHVQQMVRWLSTLNRDASRAMLASGARASTDVTGFGLLGHLTEMCSASRVSAVVRAAAIPLFPGALEYSRLGFSPAGTRTNLEAVDSKVTLAGSIDQVTSNLLADPQTSGGLLLCVPPEGLETFTQEAGDRCLAAVIGEIEEGSAGTVRVVA